MHKMSCFPRNLSMIGLGWVPIIFVAISTSGYIIPYFISSTLGHVYFVFPAISDSGVRLPEALFFRELLNISGFLSLCNVYVRYKQYQLILSALQDDKLDWIHRINISCATCGTIGGLAVTFVANFRSKKAYPVAPISEYYIHNVAAVVVFVTGLVYCSLQTYISYAMVHYNVNNRITCHWRFALTLSIICNLIVFIIANKLALSQYGTDKKPAPKLLWTPKQGGYKLHVLSSAAEWLMCFSFLWFSLTFIKEFNKIRITSDFVAETERASIINSCTNGSLDGSRTEAEENMKKNVSKTSTSEYYSLEEANNLNMKNS